mgnify:FL=1
MVAAWLLTAVLSVGPTGALNEPTQPATGQQADAPPAKTTAQKSGTPAKQPAAAPDAAEKAAEESVDLRYYRAQLELAEANLKRLQRMNQKLKRSVPASVVDQFKNDVAQAKLRVELANEGDAADEFTVWLRRARGDFDDAKSRWEKAVAVNRRAPKTFDPQDIQRYRLRAEVYRLQYVSGRALVSASREAQLEWRVELLTNELDRVKEDANRIMPAARYYYYAFPGWW